MIREERWHMPGPPPNRGNDYSNASNARRAARRSGKVTTVAPRKARIPDPNPEWHHVCVMLWEAAKNSGQETFYQETDWVFLYSLLDDLSAAKAKYHADGSGKPPAILLQTIFSAMSALGFTEGDRRRMRIELTSDAGPSEDASVTAIDQYRRNLGVVKE